MKPQDPSNPRPLPDDQSAPLEAVGRAMPYEAPAGYFDGLAGQMLAGIRAAENGMDEAEIPQLTNPLQAPPAGYFDALPGRVMSQINPQRSAASAPKKIALLRPLRLAAAALALLAAGAGIWLVARPDAPDAREVVTVSDISADDIEAFNEETGDLVGSPETAAPEAVSGYIAKLSPDDIAAWEAATGEPLSDAADIP